MADFVDAPTSEEAEVLYDVAAILDLTLKKKKKKKKKKVEKSEGGMRRDADAEKAAEGVTIAVAGSSSSAELFEPPVAVDPPTYSYSQLLNRVVDCRIRSVS